MGIYVNNAHVEYLSAITKPDGLSVPVTAAIARNKWDLNYTEYGWEYVYGLETAYTGNSYVDMQAYNSFIFKISGARDQIDISGMYDYHVVIGYLGGGCKPENSSSFWADFFARGDYGGLVLTGYGPNAYPGATVKIGRDADQNLAKVYPGLFNEPHRYLPVTIYYPVVTVSPAVSYKFHGIFKRRVAY